MIIIKNAKITTNFEPVNNDEVINKAHLDEKLSKRDGQITSLNTINLKYLVTNSL